MPGMPYSLEVGAILSALVEHTEAEKNVADLLTELRKTGAAKVPLGDLLTLSLEVPDPLGPTLPPISAKDHFNRDWLGHVVNGIPARPPNPHGVGWWVNWTGDPEAIIRETLIRGFEVALGLAHGENVANRTRCLPLLFEWACSAPMLQGWVTWMDWDPITNGQKVRAEGAAVVVTFTTPGNGHPLYSSPWRPTRPQPPYAANLADYEDPATTVGDYGLWVVGQEKTVTAGWIGKKGFVAAGDGFIPPTAGGAAYASNGPVVVVAPAEADGGWLRNGRPWI
jgi:hypothetical protein